MSTDAKQGKKKKKNRDYRVKVKDVADWTEKLNFGGLIVAEIYSEVFGPCDAMLPTIQKIERPEIDIWSANISDVKDAVKGEGQLGNSIMKNATYKRLRRITKT